MLDDFHESTRGVGVVGILLGLLVLAGFCGLGMAVISGMGKEGPTIESRIVDQERILEQVTGDLKTKKAQLEEFKKFQETVKVVESGKSELAIESGLVEKRKIEIVDVTDEIEAVQLSFEEYRDEYRVNERALAVGETLDLSETKGESFKKCKVRGISPLYLRVMQSAGPIGIPYQELPLAIQKRFQFGAEEAEAYQNQLDAANVNRDKRIAVMRKKQKALNGEAARLNLVETIKKTRLEIVKKSDFAEELDAASKNWAQKAIALDNKAASARAAGRITSNPGHARQARGKANQFARRAKDARAAATQLMKDEAEYERLLEAYSK